MEQSTSLLFLFAAVLVFAGLLWVVITFTKKGPRHFNVDEYRTRWLEIENQLSRDNIQGHSLTILNADKLLDKALREKGVQGQNMGERMKRLQKTWTNANAVWSAHKLRNKIAHEADVKVSYDDARRALAAFKRALKDVGAI